MLFHNTTVFTVLLVLCFILNYCFYCISKKITVLNFDRYVCIKSGTQGNFTDDKTKI